MKKKIGLEPSTPTLGRTNVAPSWQTITTCYTTARREDEVQENNETRHAGRGRGRRTTSTALEVSRSVSRLK